jgi:uridine monophosphate synthetase
MLNTTLSFEDRATLCAHPVAKKLLRLMAAKKTNLALSADVTSANELLYLADHLGPEICILKTHIDIIEDFTPSLTTALKQLAERHQFLIFEDRKFADIGNTVKQQYAGGIYRIADWADIINAHSLPGDGIIEGIASVNKNAGLLLLVQMSSKGHLMNSLYQAATLDMANRHRNVVFGFITQRALSPDPTYINLTPGIKCEVGSDALGQQYTTPEQAIIENGTDIIIVGRDIIADKNPIAKAKMIRERAWDAYQTSLCKA